MLKLIVFGFSSVKIIIPVMYFGEKKEGKCEYTVKVGMKTDFHRL